MILNVGLVVVMWWAAIQIVRRFRDLWTNRRGYDADVPPAIWPMGLPTWRAMNRTIPAGAVFIVLGAPLLTVLLFDDTPETVPGLQLIAIPAYTGVIISMALAATVGAFGRPKWAIAPHLRHQPGLFAEWLGARPVPTPVPTIQIGVRRPKHSCEQEKLRPARHDGTGEFRSRDDEI